MKKSVLIIVPFIAFIILAILSIIADKQLYYYGNNFFEFYHEIPYNIKPVFRHNFEGGFYLSDEVGLSIIYKGENKYWQSGQSITVKKFNTYGFSKDAVIAEVYDATGEKRFVKFSEKKRSKIDVDFDVDVLETNRKIHYEDYKWISVDEDSYYTKYVSRNRLFFATLIAAFATFFIFKVQFLKKRKKI